MTIYPSRLRFILCAAMAVLAFTSVCPASEELTAAELRALVDSVVEEVLSDTNLVFNSGTTSHVAPQPTNALPVPVMPTHTAPPVVTNTVMIPFSNAVSLAVTNFPAENPLGAGDNAPQPKAPRSWYGPRVTVGVTTVDTDEDFDFAELSAGFGVDWPEFLSFMDYGDLEFVAGVAYMRDENDDEAALLIFGPAVTYTFFNEMLTLDIGSRPTLISESELGSKPLGGPIQFISHAALRLHLGTHLEVGGRIQHMSSAGFDDPNPGADILAVDILYRP